MKGFPTAAACSRRWMALVAIAVAACSAPAPPAVMDSLPTRFQAGAPTACARSTNCRA